MESKEDTLGRHIATVCGYANGLTALESALPTYRTLFEGAVKRGVASVVNVATLRGFTRQAQRAFQSGQKEVDLRNLALEYRGSRGEDSLAMVSLFADCVGWKGTHVDAVEFAKVRAFLDAVIHADELFDCAIAIVDRPQKQNVRIDEVIHHEYGGKTDEERREILRICVLLANIHSLATLRGGQYKLVFHRLGLDELNDYKDFFVRRDGSPRTTPICKNSIRVRALDLLQPDARDNERLFLGERSAVSIEDNRRIEQYLKLNEKKYPEQFRRPYKIDSA